MKLLVLRPEPGAAATAARVVEAGFEPIVAPLFTVQAVPWTPLPLAGGVGGGLPTSQPVTPFAESASPPPAPPANASGEIDALMLTSANAVRHAGPALALYRSLPAYTVGTPTAAAARAAGFIDIRPGATDAAALLDTIAGDGVTHALHLTGREHRAVAHPKVRVTSRIVYAADAVDALSSAAEAALAEGAIALLHSPRAATLFAHLVADRAAIAIAAFSPAIAAAAGPGWRAVAIAAFPTDAALLDAARRLG